MKICNIFFISIIVILVSLVFYILIQAEPEIEPIHSANYSVALEGIEKCNEEMIFGNKTDWCTDYHDTYRECTYGFDKLSNCFDGKVLTDYFGLNRIEATELCFSFLHKGLVTNCLRKLSGSQE